MPEIMIDFTGIDTKEALHDLLEDKLPLPDHYGRNLDALYDCLTDPDVECHLSISGMDALEEALGEYAIILQRLLEDAAAENELLEIEYDEA